MAFFNYVLYCAKFLCFLCLARGLCFARISALACVIALCVMCCAGALEIGHHAIALRHDTHGRNACTDTFRRVRSNPLARISGVTSKLQNTGCIVAHQCAVSPISAVKALLRSLRRCLSALRFSSLRTCRARVWTCVRHGAMVSRVFLCWCTHHRDSLSPHHSV